MRSDYRCAAKSAVPGELWRVLVDDDGFLNAAVAGSSAVGQRVLIPQANCRGNLPGTVIRAALINGVRNGARRRARVPKVVTAGLEPAITRHKEYRLPDKAETKLNSTMHIDGRNSPRPPVIWKTYVTPFSWLLFRGTGCYHACFYS